MAYKCREVKLGEYSRRIKLSVRQREEIVQIRNEKGLSYSKIAKIFNVSSTLVNMICNPEYKKKQLENTKNLSKDGRYRKETKEEYNARMREYWAYKNKLYKEGKI